MPVFVSCDRFSISSAFPPPPALGHADGASELEMQAMSPSTSASTVSSSSSSSSLPSSSVVSFHIQTQNDPTQWTDQLAARIRQLAAADDASKASANATTACGSVCEIVQPPLEVRLFGPFANRDLDVLAFPSVVLIGGGVGVTPCASVFETLLWVRFSRAVSFCT
jgi:hypothetical protein